MLTRIELVQYCQCFLVHMRVPAIHVLTWKLDLMGHPYKGFVFVTHFFGVSYPFVGHREITRGLTTTRALLQRYLSYSSLM